MVKPKNTTVGSRLYLPLADHRRLKKFTKKIGISMAEFNRQVIMWAIRESPEKLVELGVDIPYRPNRPKQQSILEEVEEEINA